MRRLPGAGSHDRAPPGAAQRLLAPTGAEYGIHQDPDDGPAATVRTDDLANGFPAPPLWAAPTVLSVLVAQALIARRDQFGTISGAGRWLEDREQRLFEVPAAATGLRVVSRLQLALAIGERSLRSTPRALMPSDMWQPARWARAVPPPYE